MSLCHRVTLPSIGLLVLAAISCTESPSGPEEAQTRDVSSELVEQAVTGPVSLAVGRPDVGTDYFPPGSHDGSFHAQDAIRPRTSVIRAGTTVEFVIAAGHNVSVYEPGVTPGDIDTSLLEAAGAPFPFPPVINDPEGRLARAPFNFGPPLTWSWTFDEPGVYLVICDVLPHFVEARMYAWIRVQ